MTDKYCKALEEIKDIILTCEENYNCEKCKYYDFCEEIDAVFPDVHAVIVNKINEVLDE